MIAVTMALSSMYIYFFYIALLGDFSGIDFRYE
jgi:hypothetical protein